jgi:nucleoid DNA-binding protein
VSQTVRVGPNAKKTPTLVRRGFVARVAKALGLSGRKTKVILDVVFRELASEVLRGGLSWPGFGRFELVSTPPQKLWDTARRRHVRVPAGKTKARFRGNREFQEKAATVKA